MQSDVYMHCITHPLCVLLWDPNLLLKLQLAQLLKCIVASMWEPGEFEKNDSKEKKILRNVVGIL